MHLFVFIESDNLLLAINLSVDTSFIFQYLYPSVFPSTYLCLLSVHWEEHNLLDNHFACVSLVISPPVSPLHPSPSFLPFSTTISLYLILLLCTWPWILVKTLIYQSVASQLLDSIELYNGSSVAYSLVEDLSSPSLWTTGHYTPTPAFLPLRHPSLVWAQYVVSTYNRLTAASRHAAPNDRG